MNFVQTLLCFSSEMIELASVLVAHLLMSWPRELFFPSQVKLL